MIDEVNVTRKEADYLKLLYRKQIEEDDIVSTMILSRALKVTPATVTESFKRLAQKSLVEHRLYYGVKLTKRGIDEAESLLRKHRLLETLYVRHLNYSPTDACQEASKIDYYCSEDVTNSICKKCVIAKLQIL